MPRMDRLGTTATTVRTDAGATRVRYHATDVVSFTPSTITLDSGGWRTATTKNRMNQAAAQFGLGFRVYQHRGSWYVWFPARGPANPRIDLPFSDGMEISRNPEPTP